ncbi:MAG TPA: ABC transporter substrate-binding protein [Sphaerochaeta sp.]|nr:ABC transporter substrate-binding protein [Sphaerochaeta sp.]
MHRLKSEKRHTSLPFGIVFFLSLTLLLSGCKEQALHSYASKDVAKTTTSLQFTDSLGRVVRLSQKPLRVVALSASYAETWLLAGGTLVGTTSDAHTRTEFTLSKEVATIGTIKDPNSEAIISLEPDFVLLSTDIPSHLALSPLLTGCGIPHAFFHVEEMNDYLRMLEICTTLTGNKENYQTNGVEVQQSVTALLAKQAYQEDNQTYLLLRCYSTTVKAKAEDLMLSMMLSDLGLTNLTERYPSLLEDLSMETIVWEEPTYIFVIPMGDERAALATMDHMLVSNRAFASLEAVQNGRYHLLPKNLFHYKPNNRWGDSYAYLANILSK